MNFRVSKFSILLPDLDLLLEMLSPQAGRGAHSKAVLTELETLLGWDSSTLLHWFRALTWSSSVPGNHAVLGIELSASTYQVQPFELSPKPLSSPYQRSQNTSSTPVTAVVIFLLGNSWGGGYCVRCSSVWTHFVFTVILLTYWNLMWTLCPFQILAPPPISLLVLLSLFSPPLLPSPLVIFVGSHTHLCVGLIPGGSGCLEP